MSDQDRTSDSIMSLLAGIGLGALVGAVAALLLAPHSGAETRTHLRETADDALHKLRDSVDDLRSKMDEVVANTKQALGRRRDSAGELIPDVGDTTPTV